MAAGVWPERKRLRALARRAVGAAARLAAPPPAPGAELSVVFTDDAHIRALNRQFRGRDKATNVLSFPSARAPGGAAPLLGDIVLALETIAGEARDQGLSVEDHLIHLIVHGFLHLLGYGHEAEADAMAMERLETAILASIGVADPYADRGHGEA